MRGDIFIRSVLVDTREILGCKWYAPGQQGSKVYLRRLQSDDFLCSASRGPALPNYLLHGVHAIS